MTSAPLQLALERQPAKLVLRALSVVTPFSMVMVVEHRDTMFLTQSILAKLPEASRLRILQQQLLLGKIFKENLNEQSYYGLLFSCHC